MKCERCGAAVRLPDTAPGVFFRIAAAALLVALAAGAWLVLRPDADTWVLVLAALGAGVVPFAAAATWAAMADGRSMARGGGAEPGRRCDACSHVSAIRPWSM